MTWLVTAHALREPEKYAGQVIPLGYDAKTFNEVADILAQATGKPFVAEAHPPQEFLNNALAAGADPAYMTCVYTQFSLNERDAIPSADATFDNFEAITGRPPKNWHDFAQRYKAELTE